MSSYWLLKLDFARKAQPCDGCDVLLDSADAVVRATKDQLRQIYHLNCWYEWAKGWTQENPYFKVRARTNRKSTGMGLSAAETGKRRSLLAKRSRYLDKKQKYIGMRMWLHAEEIQKQIDSINILLDEGE